MENPQLRMIHHLSTGPRQRLLAEDFVLRQARDDDAEGLSAVLSRSFEEEWDVQRVNSVLLHHPEVPITWVIETDGLIVATASYQVMPTDFPKSGWVHYVGADPDFSGNGLGYVVTWAVLMEIVKAGHHNALLTTDDPRLAAIRTYLKLGFKPDMWHESHSARWENVYRRIAER